jgi:hypothetical protein
VTILKPTAAKIDSESVSWTLSWQSDGHCNSFTREAILTYAPPTSGVYGLFNFDCQVFIGESANIQEALLRHESESDFQSRHLQPTGFTFEPCTVELCRSRADELIARFHPVLQSEATLSETWSLSNGQMMSETDQSGQELETHTDNQEFPVHEREERPQVRRHFQLKLTRTQAVALVAMLVGSALVIFYLGRPADYAFQRANGANSALDQTEIGLRARNAPLIDKAGGLVNQKAGVALAKPNVRLAASTQNTAVRLAAKSADHESVKAKPNPIAHSADSAKLSKQWSVQISAAPAKDVAETLVQQLKAKGYDGYMVQAEVKGQTYYRVRVGHFTARDQAESVRQSLVRQEEYRDAYLTGH